MDKLSKEDREWWTAMESEFKNPICPNPNCNHLFSLHVIRNGQKTCGWEGNDIVCVNGLYRDRSWVCHCDLTQEEIIMNLKYQAQANIAQEERMKGVQVNHPPTTDDGGYGYNGYQGDSGTSWGV